MSANQGTEAALYGANCSRCGATRQTPNMGGNPQLYHCGSSERWQSPECEHRCKIAKLERERDGLQLGYDAAIRQMYEAIAKAEWYRTDAIRDLERQVDEARKAAYLWQERWIENTPLEECGGTLMPWMAGWKNSSANAKLSHPLAQDSKKS